MVEKKKKKHKVNIDNNRKKFSIEEYNEVASRSVLHTILLVYSEFFVKPEYYSKKLVDESGSIKFDGAYQVELSESEPAFIEEDGTIAGEFRWEASARSGRQKLLKVKAHYIVSYSGLTDCNPEAAKHFFSKVGSFAAYPYYRSFCSNISASADADLPILPILR